MYMILNTFITSETVLSGAPNPAPKTKTARRGATRCGVFKYFKTYFESSSTLIGYGIEMPPLSKASLTDLFKSNMTSQ